VANQPETKSHISYCVKKEKKDAWAHMYITPSLPHSHIYLCSSRFIVITQQHDNDRTLQAIYCYPCSLVGLLVIT